MTITLQRKSGIIVPRLYETERFYQDVKRRLTRYQKDFGNQDKIITQTFYKEIDDWLIIPRYFPIEDLNPDIQIIDCLTSGKDIDIESTIKLRNELQKRSVQFLLDNDMGIIQLSPGSGKTVITIYMMSIRKKKTLILVYRDALVDQWTERLLEFTNLKKDDIGRVTSKNYQTIFMDKPVVIATDQTLISVFKNPKISVDFQRYLYKANFGIFVGDEVHTSVGAPSFSDCSLFIPTKCNYGLSATPYRWDGNSDIIEYHLGGIFCDDGEDGVMSAKVVTLLFDYGIESNSRGYIWWGGKFQRSRYLNLMVKSDILMNVCEGLLNRFKGERSIIFVSERKKLIHEIYKRIDSNSKMKFIEDSKFADISGKNLVFATPLKIRDGIDVAEKDFLIMTSPISNIDQMSGRIRRTHPGKLEPIIVDLVDIGCKRISRTFFTRLEFYKKKSWPIKFIEVTEYGHKKEVTEDEARYKIKG